MEHAMVRRGVGVCLEALGSGTHNEHVFLLEHRDEARRLVRYEADDSHLTDAESRCGYSAARGGD